MDFVTQMFASLDDFYFLMIVIVMFKLLVIALAAYGIHCLHEQAKKKW